jgi:hypothetical protein
MAEIRPLCDVCVQTGIYNVFMDAGTKPEWHGVTWACVTHKRMYHPLVGYQPQANIAIANPCPLGCGYSMYAESAESRKSVVFACLKCGHHTNGEI